MVVAALAFLGHLLFTSALAVQRYEKMGVAQRMGVAVDEGDRKRASGEKAAKAEKTSRVEKAAVVTDKEKSERLKLGVMNKHGVTRYQHLRLNNLKTSQSHKLFWPDSNSREQNDYLGASDLTDNVSWGWHHPNGVYNTIPVGAPLIDGDMNIYLGSDDAIRKFSILGELMWSYAPRGQLAAAPTLHLAPTAPRMPSELMSAPGDDMTEQEEEMLRPNWAQVNATDMDLGSFQFFKNIKVGDIVKVKPGQGYHADGKELYKAGDQGLVSGILPPDDDDISRAVIQWTRNGHKSVVQLNAMKDRFVRVQPPKAASLPPMIVGSTTSGYIFALDMSNGEELWSTQASEQISGVKGAVAAKDGVVVVATDRCMDRYCYRYRNQTNALTPGNSVVRGLSAVDGSALWSYKTMAPVWNMVPQWGKDDTVMFSDYEGRVYCLYYNTGALKYRVGGNIGTHTHAAATYDPGHNMIFALGMQYYDHKYCNPYVAPGILPHCWTWPKERGFIRGYNASSGRLKWETQTTEPPASAAVGILNSPPGHTRLVVTQGFNCHHNSKSGIWSVDPLSGHPRWQIDGPTLWTGMCAGDKEGGDIRRAMGGRAACVPNSWSIPVVDSTGDVYVGNQVGVLQRYGSPTGKSKDVGLLSTLTTGVAFQDAAIAFAPGIMAVSTCTSLIVFQTSNGELPSEATPPSYTH